MGFPNLLSAGKNEALGHTHKEFEKTLRALAEFGFKPSSSD